MWAKLIYRFEDMTEKINGAFMEDLGELLSSVTGHQRKMLYEIDQEFEKMCEILLKNFATIKSLMPFLRSSLRQTMNRKLSMVGKDKEAWKKAEEYLTQLQDDEQMITLERRTSPSNGESSDCIATKKQVQQSKTRWRSRQTSATQRIATPSSLPWKRKSKPFMDSCAEIQQEQS